MGSLSIILIAVFAAVVFALNSYIRIESEEEAVVERRGRFLTVLKQGSYFLVPFFDNLRGLDFPDVKHRGKIILSPLTMSFPNDDRVFYTKSNNQLKIRSKILYQITDSYKAVYEVDYLFDAINQLVAGIIQNRLLKNEHVDVNEEVEFLKELCNQIPEDGNKYCEKWGVKLLKVELSQIIDLNGIRYYMNKNTKE